MKIRELKYRIVLALEFKFPIWLLCEIAGISKSSFYKFKKKTIDFKNLIEDKVIDIYNKTNKRAGYRTIKLILKNQYNLIVNHKKVQRIMQKHDLQSIVRKKHKKVKEQVHIQENILKRDFKANKAGEKFATDITYIPTLKKMMYLCVVIDLFNNEPVAWKISDTQDKSLSIETINKLACKYDLNNSIIHSDQGIHYTNKDYVALLKELNVRQSMSRKGNCWDNAKAESFFSHYKCESIYLINKKIKSSHEVEELTEEYMDYYINYRPQKKLGGLPPSLYKQKKII